LKQDSWSTPTPDFLAHLLMATLTEGVLLIERAADPDVARAQVERAALALLEACSEVAPPPDLRAGSRDGRAVSATMSDGLEVRQPESATGRSPASAFLPYSSTPED
jgi:hypothetical protein